MRFVMNGAERGNPRNWRDITISINWNDDTQLQVDTDSLEFVGEANQYIRQWVQDGLTGGIGVFEGIPFDLVLDSGQRIEGYLDLTENEYIGDEEVITRFFPRKNVDWLTEVADSFSFRYLESKNIITDSDFVRVPYVINYIPDGLALSVASVTLFVIVKEIISDAKELQEQAAHAISVTDQGGAALRVALLIAAYLIYTTAMVIAVINLLDQILSNLYQPRRFHKGIRMKKLFEKALEYLEMELDSDLLDSWVGDLVYIPQKNYKGGDEQESGVPLANGPIDTFGQLVRVFKSMTNSQYIIDGDTFKIERNDFQQGQSGYVIPDTLVDQGRLLDRYSPNASEIKSNVVISFSYDPQDRNTLDNTTGMVYQAITRPEQIENEEYVNLKGLDDVQIPFALANRKNRLTGVEEVIRGLAQLADSLVGIFGGGSSFTSQINARIGAMSLSSDFITVPKLVYMDGAVLANNQRTRISAKRLWEEFHFIKSFVEIDGTHNQWVIDNPRRIQLNDEEFLQLFNNRYGVNQDGEDVRFDELKWNSWNKTAEVVARVNRKYTENLKLEYVE